MYRYNTYKMLLEKSVIDKKKDKAIEKIKKFLNVPEIYKYVISKCTSQNSAEGLQYAVWFANIIKNALVSYLKYLSDDKLTDAEIIEKLKSDVDQNTFKDYPDIDWYLIVEEFGKDPIEYYTKKDGNKTITFNAILDWFKSPIRTEKINLSELSYDDAIRRSQEWHDSLRASGKITDESGDVLIEFEDGFYWIDLNTTSSRDEADAMGHCGRTSCGNTLLSLRDKNKSPHVTVAFDSEDGIIYQMKGRNNKKPIDKYHPYIYRLLVDPNTKTEYFSEEYDRNEDFNLADFDKETFLKVYKYNPELIYKSLAVNVSLCKELIEKEYIMKEEMRNILLNTADFNVAIFLMVLDYDMFSKEELIEFKEMLNFNLNRFNELAYLKMFNRNLLTREELMEKFSEIVQVDGKLYVDGDDRDLDSFMSEIVKTVLFDDDWYEYGNYYKVNNISEVMDDLTKETKEAIINKMVGLEIQLENDGDEDYTIESVERNMFEWKKIGRNEDFYLTYSDNEYSLTDIIEYNEDYELDDIYRELDHAYNDAQESANMSAYYEKSKKSLEDVLCDYERVSTSIKLENGKTKYFEYLRFPFYDLFDLDDMISHLEKYYDNDCEESEYFGSIWSILVDMKNGDRIADFDDRYVYGSIDDKYLNECVIDNLSWI